MLHGKLIGGKRELLITQLSYASQYISKLGIRPLLSNRNVESKVDYMECTLQILVAP